jgi:hypothetical protein
MWIKVFYWMRLFPSYAYYVKLIQQTVTDAKEFTVMVLIIMVSFSAFFFIINRNQIDAGEDEYVPAITGASVALDSLISVYLLGALGDFDVGMYQAGYNKYVAIGMFLLATFLIQAVFMNMLIAIMGETFGQVLEAAEENGLREQVVLMADFLWLVNLKKVFKGQRYVIRLRPSAASGGADGGPAARVAEAEEALAEKIEKLQRTIQRNFDGGLADTRYLAKNQNLILRGVVERLKAIEGNQSTQMINGGDIDPEHVVD